MTPQMGLFLSAIAFVGTHFLLSHSFREPLVRRVGEGAFRGIYSLVAIVTFGSMVWFYRVIGREPQLWEPGEAAWIAGEVLMWLGAILLLAGVGAALQDRKKAGQMGDAWHEWTAQTAFWPFARGLANPGALALVGGTLLFLAATWLHPMPVGLWRWIG